MSYVIDKPRHPAPSLRTLRHRATNSAQVSRLGLGATSRSVGQALALDPGQGAVGPLHVIEPELGAGVLPETNSAR